MSDLKTEYYDNLKYALYVLRHNWARLKSFERPGYMGKDPKYQPHGIDRDIWKQAYKMFQKDR